MKVFVVNGAAASGKTTFENMVMEVATRDDYDVGVISIIDYVKKVAEDLGWTGTKTEKDRKMLCDLKKVLTEWNDSPYTKLKEKILACKFCGLGAIFVDSREAKDIKRLVEDFNATTILIRDPEKMKVRLGNTADDNIMEYGEYHIEIDNNGTLEDLHDLAEAFYYQIIKG